MPNYANKPKESTMPNYANAHDLRMCEPPDTSIEDDKRQAQCDDAFSVYLSDGHLPGNYDTSHVDERMAEIVPDALDALIDAKDDEELARVAKLLRDTRIKVIEDLIADNLEVGKMSELKATPGPWVVDYKGTAGHVKFVPKKAVEHSTRTPTVCRYDIGIVDPVEEKANAHLIAAARELYEELQNARDIVQALIDDGYTGYMNQRDDIDSVLAKARGQ